MENNRVKLDICGVSIALITDKDESYVHRLADEITAEISPMISAGISKDRAAVFAAFNYLDQLNELKNQPQKDDNAEEIAALKAEAEKLQSEINELKKKLADVSKINEELENSLVSSSKEPEEILALRKENENLLLQLGESKSNSAKEEEYKKKLDEAIAELEEFKQNVSSQKEHVPVYSSGELRNPMRPQLEAEGMVDYYAKD